MSERVINGSMLHRSGVADWATSGHGLWTFVRQAVRRQASRHALVTLDAHMLKDIGISAMDAEWEANKAFWQR